MSTEIERLLERAEMALSPFADCVNNDNHDMTVTKRVPTTDELRAAYFVRRDIRSALATLASKVSS